MDLRKEAELRAAAKQKQNAVAVKPVLLKKPTNQLSTSESMELIDLNADSNPTPDIAKRAAIEFRLNGTRARTNTGDFIGPRWVLDEEVDNCSACHVHFVWMNRRHHCRHCGKIFCDNCSSFRCLLPHEFGLRDPQRVCRDCNDTLFPLQRVLTNDIANHQRVNAIDIGEETCSTRRFMNLPFAITLGSEIRKAAYTTHNLFSRNWISDESIPLNLIRQAKGLAFMTVAKGGFVVAPRLGTGLVIARLPDGRWSAPTAIGTVGVSWGALVGADITDYVIILNNQDALEAFSGTGQISIGAGIDVAIGPVGRSAEADISVGDGGVASAYSYSHSRGLYAGVSLDGALILSRPDVNHRFYGRIVSPADILRGLVSSPRAAQPLYDALAEAEAALPNPQHNFATIVGAGGKAIGPPNVLIAPSSLTAQPRVVDATQASAALAGAKLLQPKLVVCAE